MMQHSLTQIFSALAGPTRRAMLAQLKLGESSVSDLAKPYNISLPAVTKHIKVLEKAGSNRTWDRLNCRTRWYGCPSL